MLIRRTFVMSALALAVLAGCSSEEVEPDIGPTVPVVRRIAASRAIVQNDVCLWRHPTHPERSLVIATDHDADKIFVYDLEGDQQQLLVAGRPAGIDARSGFRYRGDVIDVVVVLETEPTPRLCVYQVDAAARRLRRIDDGSISCDKHPAVALLRDRADDRLYAVMPSKGSSGPGLARFELFENGSGMVAGRRAGSIRMPRCSSVVVDDDTGVAYLAEERKGIWTLPVNRPPPFEPTLTTSSALDGLDPGIRGLALIKRPHATFLVASNFWSRAFAVFRCGDTLTYVGSFHVSGADEPTAIDVHDGRFGAPFPDGLFACIATARSRAVSPVFVVSTAEIVSALGLDDVAPEQEAAAPAEE
ncbi:MAG: phytase [Planctomycetota bacterium]|jgi:3-phytase